MTTKSPEKIKEEFLSFTEEDAVDLSGIAHFVKCNCNATIPLIKPRGSTLRICGQDGTVFEGDEEQLEAWKDFYLPERMEMEVIGAIDDFPCDAFGLQLVLLLGEDGSVFAYEDELLHLVARSLRDLFQCEMVFPGIEIFKLGECFEEPTEEEYHEMMESNEVQAMKKLHMDFRESLEHELLNTMNDIAQRRNNNQLHDNQSGFKNGHSTETALLSVTEAQRTAKTDSKSSVLILPDLSARYIDQNFLSTLPSLGITRFFKYNTLLGPIMAHGFSYHCYAEDTQLCFLFQLDDPMVAAKISECLEDILAWMNEHHLELNLVKTELFGFSTNFRVILTVKRHRRHIATTAQSSRSSLHMSNQPQLIINNNLLHLYSTFHGTQSALHMEGRGWGLLKPQQCAAF